MSLLSETNMPRYRMIRRLTGPILTLAAVKKYEGHCNPVLERYVDKMTKEQGEPLDLLKWMHSKLPSLIQNVNLIAHCLSCFYGAARKHDILRKRRYHQHRR